MIATDEALKTSALAHVKQAEIDAAKLPADVEGASARRVERVGIVGAGTMGGGISMAFANAGIPVTLVETAAPALERGVGIIRKNYGASVAKGKLAQADMDKRVALIDPTLDYERLAAVDLVIEAVFEEMKVKQDVFARLDRIARGGAILATNTSRLDVNEIAAATSRPQDVIGMHFFSPANVMKLLEVVRARKSAPDVVATAMQTGRRVGKVVALVGVCEGFVGNRMLTPYIREAGFLLEEGASPQQVDRALTSFGMAMGPFAVGDLAGLDIGWEGRKRLAPTRPKHLRYSKVADRICEMGRFGQKTGAGWYRYEAGSRTPIPDPQIEALIEQCAREAGIERRTIGDEEIVERAIYALVNEGAKILEDGIARSASDIDLIWVNGYGFPAARGGPMFHAQTVGLDKVLARIREFHAKHGELWTPAPLLERLVREGRRFDEEKR